MLASQLGTEPAPPTEPSPPALEGDPKLWTARELPLLLIADLRSFLSNCSNVAVRWVPRICNEAAHILAKWSLFCNFYGSFDVSFSPDCFSSAVSSGLL